MKKWFTRLLLGGLTLVLLLVAVVVALPWIIDPNDFKPEIQSLAAKQGIDLRLEGPIAWQFYPTIGLSLRDVNVAPSTDTAQPLARVKELTAAVAVTPLLQRQVRVTKVIIDGADVALRIDENGHGNWEALTAADNTTEPPTSTNTAASGNLDLTVETIAVHNTALLYEDRQSGQTTQLRSVDVGLSGVNLQQHAFPFDISAEIQNTQLAQPLTLNATGQLRVNDALTQFAADDIKLTAAGVALQLSAEAQTAPQLQYQGTLDLAVDDLPQLVVSLGQTLPATQDDAVLKQLRFNGRFDGSDRQAAVNDFTLVLDDTTFKGSTSVTFPNDRQRLAITFDANGDAIDVDRYSAPASETTSASDTTASTDSPLPVDALRSLDATITAKLDRVVVNKMPITQLQLALTGNNGRWQLQKFNADFYQGKLLTTGELRAEQQYADVQLNADMKGLALKPLLTDVAAFDGISGTVDAHVEGTTRAATSQQLLDKLNATIHFTGNSLVISGINAEQQYCNMVTQLSRMSQGDPSGANAQEPNTTDDAGNKTWAQETAINNVEGNLRFDNLVLTMEAIQAQVANLKLTAKGAADLNKQTFAVSLPMRLTDNVTSADGCRIDSQFLINRDVDILGCDGSLAQLDLAKQCGLKSGAISDLAKQALRYNADKKITEKKQDAREQLKEKLREKLGGEKDSNSTRDLLKNILKR